MQPRHGAFRAMFDQQGQAIRGGTDRLQDQILFRARCTGQHVIDDIGLVTRMAYPQAQAPKRVADVRDDIEKNLQLQEQSRLAKQWIDGLKKKTYIRYFFN